VKSIPRLIWINTLLLALIGLLAGVMLSRALLWTLGGALFGALLGWLANTLYSKVSAMRNWPFARHLLLLFLVEALLILYLVIPSVGAYEQVYPSRNPLLGLTPTEIAPATETVTLHTADDLTLHSWYIPSQNGAAIIALHGLGGNRLHVVPHARLLAEAGFGVLLLDMRAHGESEGERFSHCLAANDVLAAIEYLKSRGEVQAERIGAMGISSGAQTALCTAAQTPDLRALWLEGLGLADTSDALHPMLPEIRPLFFNIPLNWMFFRTSEGLSGSGREPAVRQMLVRYAPRPVVFVAAGQDFLEPALARRYAADMGQSGEAWVISNAPHGAGLTTAWDEYARRMVEFFGDSLPKTASP